MSLGALKGLIIKLGGLREGRKALILVSEGYTNYLPRAAARSGGVDARRRQPHQAATSR